VARARGRAPARASADALREATVALTRSLDADRAVTLLDRMRGMSRRLTGPAVMLLDEASRVSVRAVFDGDRIIP